jgi:hypothetical protein
MANEFGDSLNEQGSFEMASVPAMNFTELLLIIMTGIGIGMPLGVPPQQPDPMLANIAPAQCLYYATWVGMADPDPASANNTERLLAEPEIKKFVSELQAIVQQVAGKIGERGGPGERVVAQHLPLLAKTLLTHSTAIFVESVAPQPNGIDARGALVVNLGDDLPQVKEALKTLRQQIPPKALQEVDVAGISCVRVQPQPNMPAFTIGFQDRYLIVAVGEKSFEGVLERAKNAPPDWLKQAVADVQLAPRPGTLAYVNLEAVLNMAGSLGGPRVQAGLNTLGLSGLTRAVSTSGLDETGFVSRIRVVAKAGDRGLLKVLSEKPLTAKDLAGVPRDASIAAALRLDLAQVLEQGLEIARELEPAAASEFEMQLSQMEQQLGVALRKDLLQALGDVWTIHAAPSSGGLMAGWTLAVDVRDKSRLEATHAKLLQIVQAQLAQTPVDQPPRIRTFEFGRFTAYTLDVPGEGFFAAPSWCLTDSHLVVTLFPQALKSYLTQCESKDSLADQSAVVDLLNIENGPCALSYQDTRGQFLAFYPWLQIGAQMASKQLAKEGLDINAAALPSTSSIAPHLLPSTNAVRKTADGFELLSHSTLPGTSVGASAPMAVALLLPAIQSAREAARRAQSMNNMKQIGLAVYNYYDMHKAFPPAYSVDKSGKPLLSWRVYILPFIEQQALYEQFHLDEPWDSEHNRTLIERMPVIYLSPNSTAGPGKTIYLGNAGKDGVFVPAAGAGREQPLGLPIMKITDGTSNTIMVVEAGNAAAVTWTKPDDFVPRADNPLQGLIGTRPGGFLALLCDGSVRFIAESIDKNTLKALFTAGGGEATPADY